jgi:hypothetical protein
MAAEGLATAKRTNQSVTSRAPLKPVVLTRADNLPISIRVNAHVTAVTKGRKREDDLSQKAFDETKVAQLADPREQCILMLL